MFSKAWLLLVSSSKAGDFMRGETSKFLGCAIVEKAGCMFTFDPLRSEVDLYLISTSGTLGSGSSSMPSKLPNACIQTPGRYKHHLRATNGFDVLKHLLDDNKTCVPPLTAKHDRRKPAFTWWPLHTLGIDLFIPEPPHFCRF